MDISVSEIESQFSDSELFSARLGDDTKVERIAAAEDCGPGDLVFIDRKEFLPLVDERKPSAVVIDEKISKDLDAKNGVGFLITKNVRLAHALVKQKYHSRDFDNEGWGRIHPSAIVHESVEVPTSVHIGPNAVVSKNVELAENVRIMAGCVIESGVQIGTGTVLHPNVTVGYNCFLGENVEVGPGSNIGSEGFGYGHDEKRKAYKIPQTGNVILEDNVQIGSGNSIDRGSYGATRIGAGTKTDNLCHIAHGVQIGNDCMLTAMFCVAGTTEIGDRVWTSGQTGILDHMKICSDVVLLHRAGVSKDITEAGMYAGLPLQPLAQYMKNSAHAKNLTEMNKKLKALEKQVEVLTNNKES